jgi:hypothetical protein
MPPGMLQTSMPRKQDIFKSMQVFSHNQRYAGASTAAYVTGQRICEISRISGDQAGSLKTSKHNALGWHVHGGKMSYERSRVGTASVRPTYEEKAVRRRQIEERKAKPSIWGGV